MRVELRREYLILLPESELESRQIDKIFGDKVGNDGFIAAVTGCVKLTTDLESHYISLRKA